MLKKVQKIKVIDSSKTEHVFKGENLRFFHSGMVCRVYDYVTRDTVASFSTPISVKAT